jgi:CRISPR-associated protein Csx14
MAKVALISSLGLAPGVVTGMVDALIEGVEQKYEVGEVVVIYTRDPNMPADKNPIALRELIKEFKIEKYKGISFDPQGGVVKFADVDDLKSNRAFFAKAITEIRRCLRQYGKENVIVSLAGGRKTMSALMATAALIEKVPNVYHLIVDEWVEKHGNPENWLGKEDIRTKVMHPDKKVLVQLPDAETILKLQEEAQTATNDDTFGASVSDYLRAEGTLE